MAITPQTNIRLLKVPFEIDNKNQLTFSSKQAQTDYFLGLNAIEVERAQYQRKNNIMYFPAHIDSIMEYNYVMYQNDNYSDKWFYAFITNKAYNNDGLTDLTLKTDVFQTWQFDIVYKRSFIEREHVNDDTVGLHTIPENLDVGEVICENTTKDTSYDLTNGYYLIVESTYNPATRKDFKYFTIVNSIPAGSQYFAFKIYPYNPSASQYKELVCFITQCYVDGKIDSIKNIYIVPDAAILGSWLASENMTIVNWSDTIFDIIDNAIQIATGNIVSINHIEHVQGVENFDTEITKRTSFSGITLKNNKCFTYPYNYIFVSNNTGNNNIFKYENFSSSSCKFRNYVGYTQGADSKLVPLNYKGKTYDEDEALPLGKYPNCSWASDAFTNWLTQNAVNIPASVLTTAVSSAAGIAVTAATGGALAPVGAGLVSTGASTLANLIGEFREASLLPSIQSGQNNGNVNFSANKNGFIFYEMRSKNEYIKIIDDFFSMYGYKINEVKIPNITGRRNWNYVKTIDCNLLGEIPQSDLEEIKQIFNNGVTFWHNSATFLDYSQNNAIV